MANPTTNRLQDITGDLRVLSRMSHGYEWNHWNDSESAYFGSSQDVDARWDGTDFDVLALADDQVWKWGTGTNSWDMWWYGNTADDTMVFDASANRFTLDGVDLRLNDSDILQFGDAADVAVTWNATNLVITPAVDDTGAIHVGNGTLDMDMRVHLGTTSDYVEFDVGAKALEVVGDTRVDFSSATVAAGNTDGGVIKGGTSGTPIVEDTANMKFISFYFDNGALSGSAEGLYLRLYDTGAGKTSQALRAFTSVTDVAAANARGAHVSLSFGATGSVTGLGTALETTLHIPSGGGLAGTVSSIKAAINSDGAGSDPAGSRISVFNVVNQGDGTGAADVDDDCALLDFQGWGVASGDMLYTNTSTPGDSAGSIRIKLPDGSLGYLRWWAAQA